MEVVATVAAEGTWLTDGDRPGPRSAEMLTNGRRTNQPGTRHMPLVGSAPSCGKVPR